MKEITQFHTAFDDRDLCPSAESIHFLSAHEPCCTTCGAQLHLVPVESAPVERPTYDKALCESCKKLARYNDVHRHPDNNKLVVRCIGCIKENTWPRDAVTTG